MRWRYSSPSCQGMRRWEGWAGMSVPEVPASLRSWMSAVSEIVRSVNAAEPLEKVLTRVAVQACELIGFEFCAVMLADERRECLHIAGCSGLTPDYLAQVSDGRSLRIHPPGPDLDTPAARAYREDRTIVVPDVRKAPSYGRLRHLAPTQGYQALLASPLRGSTIWPGSSSPIRSPHDSSADPSWNSSNCSAARPRWPWRRHGCGPSSRRSSGSCPGPTTSCAGGEPCWSGPSSSTTS